jgi:CBS domain-containing protein
VLHLQSDGLADFDYWAQACGSEVNKKDHSMTVASILKSKGSNVVTIQPGQRMLEVSRILHQHRIGAALVLGPGNRVMGVLSERDIVRAMAEIGGAALEAPVNDFMTTNVRTCRPSDSIEWVMEVMTKSRFRHMPVVEDGQLLGIISIGDVVNRRIDDTEHEAEALKRYIVAG